MTTSDWTQRLHAWQDLAGEIRARAERADNMRRDRAWKLAESVGIGRCACSLHNASIDDEMRGWCANNPERLRVAKRAVYLMDSCRAQRIADSIITRAYNRIVRGEVQS